MTISRGNPAHVVKANQVQILTPYQTSRKTVWSALKDTLPPLKPQKEEKNDADK